MAHVRDSNITDTIQAIENHELLWQAASRCHYKVDSTALHWCFFSGEGSQRGFDRMSFPTSGIGLALDGGSYSSIVVRIYVVCQVWFRLSVPLAGITIKLSRLFPVRRVKTSVITRWWCGGGRIATLFESVQYMFVKAPTQSSRLAISREHRTTPNQEKLVPLPRDLVLQHPNTRHFGKASIVFYLELVDDSASAVPLHRCGNTNPISNPVCLLHNSHTDLRRCDLP